MAAHGFNPEMMVEMVRDGLCDRIRRARVVEAHGPMSQGSGYRRRETRDGALISA